MFGGGIAGINDHHGILDWPGEQEFAGFEQFRARPLNQYQSAAKHGNFGGCIGYFTGFAMQG